MRGADCPALGIQGKVSHANNTSAGERLVLLQVPKVAGGSSNVWSGAYFLGYRLNDFLYHVFHNVFFIFGGFCFFFFFKL